MALTEAEKVRSRAAGAKYRAENKAKECARVARYRAANSEKIAAYRNANIARNSATSIAWQKANPERFKAIVEKSELRPARKQRHLHLNPEQKAARVAIVLAYKARNPEKVAAMARAYKEKNRDKINVNKQNRRARKNASGGRLSHGIRAKLMGLQRGKCAGCATDLNKSGSHLDHIMPLALDGAHADVNIQLLCPPCNRVKNAKDPIDWAQQNGRLL